MIKKVSFALAILLVASIVLLAAAPAANTLARLTIRNNTGGNVSVSLKSGLTNYYLVVPSGKTNVYTVARKIYAAQFWACGTTASGASVDILTNLKLNFPACTFSGNSGEPSMEKVHLKDTPTGLMWRFQY